MNSWLSNIKVPIWKEETCVRKLSNVEMGRDINEREHLVTVSI